MGRAKGDPEIITGPKSPADFPERDEPSPGGGPDPIRLAQQTAELAKPEPRAPGQRVFHSRIRFLRVQVKTQADRMDMATGTIIRGDTKYAQFKDGELKTSDPEEIAAVERCRSFQTGDVWDADAVRQNAAVASYEALVSQVLNNPELTEKLRRDERLKKVLNVGEFPLPNRGPEVRSAEPSPSA